MCLSPERLNCAQCGFGHENRVYLSCAGVVSIMVVLLWQGMDQKIQIRRQFCHVTILQDYPFPDLFETVFSNVGALPRPRQ